MAAGPSSGPPLASACLGAGGLPASPVLACRWADSVVTDTDRVAGNLRLHLGGPVGAGLEDRRVGEGCGGGLWRRVGGGFEEGLRRVGGGLEEGGRTEGGRTGLEEGGRTGLEEGWRRVGGGLEDGLWRRRVGGGLEEGLRTVGGGWERQGWRRVGGQGWRRAAGQCGCALVKGQLGVRGSRPGQGVVVRVMVGAPIAPTTIRLLHALLLSAGALSKRQQLGWDIAQM